MKFSLKFPRNLLDTKQWFGKNLDTPCLISIRFPLLNSHSPSQLLPDTLLVIRLGIHVQKRQQFSMIKPDLLQFNIKWLLTVHNRDQNCMNYIRSIQGITHTQCSASWHMLRHNWIWAHIQFISMDLAKGRH